MGALILGLLLVIGVLSFKVFGLGSDGALMAPDTLDGQQQAVSPDLTRRTAQIQRQIEKNNEGAEAMVVAYGKPDGKLLLLHGVRRRIDIPTEFRDARVTGAQTKVGRSTCATDEQENAVLCLRTGKGLSIGVFGYRVSGPGEVAKAVDEAWEQQ